MKGKVLSRSKPCRRSQSSKSPRRLLDAWADRQNEAEAGCRPVTKRCAELATRDSVRHIDLTRQRNRPSID